MKEPAEDPAAALIAAHVSDVLNAPPKNKGGRRSKAEELAEFAEATGLDMALVKDFLGDALKPKPKPKPEDDPPPDNWAAWEDEMMRLLWVNRNELKGIAMVQALKAIATLAEHQRDREGPEEITDDRRPLLDRIEALPPEHAAALVKQELARIDLYRDDLLAALTTLEAK